MLVAMNSSTQPSGLRRRLYVPVFSVEAEVGPYFVESILPGHGADLVIHQSSIHIECLSSAVLDARAENVEKLRQADAFVLLAHYLDLSSLEEARRIYHRLQTVRPVPLGVFICRPPEEHQFKISCLQCGQKLWVMENEIGLRGRCVNCRAPMTIVPPSEYTRRVLSLPDAVPVLNVVRGNAAVCRGALANLLSRTGTGAHAGLAGAPENFLKQATVQIQIPPEP
jgi:hypothetical protein